MPEDKQLTIEDVIGLAERIEHWQAIDIMPDASEESGLGDQFLYIVGDHTEPFGGYLGKIRIEGSMYARFVSRNPQPGFEDGRDYEIVVGDERGLLGMLKYQCKEEDELKDPIALIYRIAEDTSERKLGSSAACRILTLRNFLATPKEAKPVKPRRGPKSK